MNIYVTTDQKRRLDFLTEETGVPTSVIIRQGIDLVLADERYSDLVDTEERRRQAFSGRSF